MFKMRYFSCEHDSAKKGKGRRQRSRSPAPRETSAEKQCAKKTGKNSCGKEDRPPCHSYKKGNCGCDRKCAFWHPPHCKYFKTKKCRLGKDCLYVHSQAEDRSTRLQRRGEGKLSSQEGSAIAILNTASHQPGNKTRRAERSETAEDDAWKAEANL